MTEQLLGLDRRRRTSRSVSSRVKHTRSKSESRMKVFPTNAATRQSLVYTITLRRMPRISMRSARQFRATWSRSPTSCVSWLRRRLSTPGMPGNGDVLPWLQESAHDLLLLNGSALGTQGSLKWGIFGLTYPLEVRVQNWNPMFVNAECRMSPETDEFRSEHLPCNTSKSITSGPCLNSKGCYNPGKIWRGYKEPRG